MARPKGSKNKPKAEGAPTGARKANDTGASNGAGPGHNKPELSDDEKRVLLLQGVTKIEALKSEQAAIGSKISLERKRLKADGFAKEEVNYALFLRKSTDAEALDQRKREADVARWLAHPVGFQVEMFGDGVDRTPGVDAAFEAGKNAGIVGEPCKVPDRWSEASEQGQRWMQGWHDGQKLLLSDGIKLLQERHSSVSQDVEDDAELPPGEVLPGADDSGSAGYELRN